MEYTKKEVRRAFKTLDLDLNTLHPEEAIKSAYRKLVKIYHPDKCFIPSSKENHLRKFIAIKDAYELAIAAQASGYHFKTESVEQTSTYSGDHSQAYTYESPFSETSPPKYSGMSEKQIWVLRNTIYADKFVEKFPFNIIFFIAFFYSFMLLLFAAMYSMIIIYPIAIIAGIVSYFSKFKLKDDDYFVIGIRMAFCCLPLAIWQFFKDSSVHGWLGVASLCLILIWMMIREIESSIRYKKAKSVFGASLSIFDKT